MFLSKENYMTTIMLSEQIITLDKLINKSMDNLTFKEIVSLVFHAIIAIVNDPLMPGHSEWKEIYQQFEKNLREQNQVGWPNMKIIKNDMDRRIDVYSLRPPFIISDNILTLLLQILYMEKYKRSYVFKTYHYHKILGHTIKYRKKNIIVEQCSLENIFDCLKAALEYYVKIYKNDIRIEYQLSYAILKQIS